MAKKVKCPDCNKRFSKGSLDQRSTLCRRSSCGLKKMLGPKLPAPKVILLEDFRNKVVIPEEKPGFSLIKMDDPITFRITPKGQHQYYTIKRARNTIAL